MAKDTRGTLTAADVEWATKQVLRDVEGRWVERQIREPASLSEAIRAARNAVQGECHTFLADGTPASWFGLNRPKGILVRVADRSGIVTWRELAVAVRASAVQSGLDLDGEGENG